MESRSGFFGGRLFSEAQLFLYRLLKAVGIPVFNEAFNLNEKQQLVSAFGFQSFRNKTYIFAAVIFKVKIQCKLQVIVRKQATAEGSQSF